ncbi:MAG: TonB family protein, partial [Acidobacteriota bacterium]
AVVVAVLARDFGIAESDNLEVRIMSLLRTSKFTPRRKTLLLITALLVLAVPCVAGATFALALDIERQEPTPEVSQQSRTKITRQNDRTREELKRQTRVLKDQMRVATESQRQELEVALRELQRDLDDLDRQRPETEARLRDTQKDLEEQQRIVQQNYQQTRADAQKRLEELRASLAEWEKNRPANEARMREARQQIAEMEKLYTADREREVQKSIAEMQKAETDRKAKLIYKVEPSYTEEARRKNIEGSVLLGLTIDHEGLPQNIQVKRSLEPSLDNAAIEAVRKWRFLPAIKDGQPVSMYITAEVYFRLDYKHVEQEQKEREAKEKPESKGIGKGEGNGAGNGEGYSGGPLEMRRRKDTSDQGREERARKQAAMTRDATISMDRAIQIAISQVPGKVLACSLGRDGDMVFYHLVIITTEGDKNTTTYVWLSATDGHIIKTEKEKQNQEQEW